MVRDLIGEKLKISIIIFFSFLFAFTSIYFMDSLMNSNIGYADTSKIIFQSDIEKTRIFLIGSSRMMGLDSKYLDDFISKNGKKVDVYNQGLSSDLPSRRLTVLDVSVSNQPDIIFVGIDLSNFLSSQKETNPVSAIPTGTDGYSQRLPNVQDLYLAYTLEGDFFENNLSTFDNPKFTTLKFIQVNIQRILYGVTIDPKQVDIQIDDQERGKQNPNDFEVSKMYLTEKQSWDFENPKFRIVASDELIDRLISKGGGTDYYSKANFDSDGLQAKSLKNIIETIQKNKIKVVLFTTPVHKKYIESYSSILKEDFKKFLEEISKEYGIPVYHFHDKYSGFNIWRDNQHVIWGETAYTNDIAEIILKEI